MAIKDLSNIDYVEVMKDRKQINRLVSVANKRIVRLKNNKLDDSPAMKFVPESGKFSIKNKHGNALRSEVAKMRSFLRAQTSTIRGYDKLLKDLAKTTGMHYNKVRDIRARSARFFELASKVEQYLRNVQGIASSVGYEKIWEAINEFVKTENTDLLKNTNVSVDDLILDIVNMIEESDKEMRNSLNQAKLDLGDFTFLE